MGRGARPGRPQRPARVATVFAIVYTGDGLLNTALGLYKPWQWSRREAAIDVVNKLVLAEATGAVFDALRGRTSAPAGVAGAVSP
jgi:hypothetical protein